MLVLLGAGALLLGQDWSGVYWIVPEMLISFVVALLDAWVRLIEINR